MRILFTGGSSFTGHWFVRALAEAGHEVVCPLRGGIGGGPGLRTQRVTLLRNQCEWIAKTPFGSDAFVKLCQERQFDLLCHHAAEVGNYKSADFDALGATASNTHKLRAVLAALKRDAAPAVVLTGSYFECDEGQGDEPLRAFSPYGLSKAFTWQVFRFLCGEVEAPLGKFVIPNPFGPFEEGRFTGYLMNQWRQGKPATVRTPDYVRDNVHVDLLAAVYRQFAERVVAERRGNASCHPSGYTESQGEFTARVARETTRRTPWACEIERLPQTEFPEPRSRMNTDPAAAAVPGWSESAAWDAFVRFHA